MKIAVDAMGGDRAPLEILAGVSRALDRGFVSPADVALFGQIERLEPLLGDFPSLDLSMFRDARQVVEMAESPTKALRQKPESSIQVALRAVKESEAGAFVSAGNTGAVVACGLATLGRIPGIHRPGIAVTFQSASGPVMILDVGANVHCKPIHLFHYGLMADTFCRDLLGVESPRIGLLNIGEEEQKGNELVRGTRDLFEQSPLNFIGNVEGTSLLSGRCQVVVCEGFVGNVVLKVTEGIGHFLQTAVKEQLRSESADSPLANALHAVTSKLDYAEYGGAPLLGVNGLVMIMHGRSDRRATANAMRVAKQFLEAGVNDHIRGALSDVVGSRGASP
jgi:glycerol-3-phosphate acyltransferase PlsX